MTGSITRYKKKNTRFSWGYYFRTGKKPDGKWNQVTKQGFATKAEAEAALRKAIVDYEAQQRNPMAAALAGPKTFGEFFDLWIEKHCMRKCESSTTEGYVKKGIYAKQHLGDIAIENIGPLQIETALNDLLDRGGKKTRTYPAGRPLSVKTVRDTAAVISMTFGAAIRWGKLDRNPMERVTLPKKDEKESKVLEKTDLEWVISAVEGHPWMDILLTLDAGTGARRGEMLALTWSDIDFDLKNIRISKSLAQTKEKGIFIKRPKGRKSRTFSLSDSLIEALRRHRIKQAEQRRLFGRAYRADLDLVIASSSGEYLKPGLVSADISRLLRKLGFPKGVSLHTLRHTHGSHLLSIGVPLPTVSKRLGHANTHITALVYSHALEKDDRTAADAWEKVIGDMGNKPDARIC
ncbi:MAG: tyrosine-type recombinase/integrase [Bryobacteraceae bacterium]